MNETKVINMNDYLHTKQDREIQASMLCKHARTMLMMYEATGDRKYIHTARIDIRNAKSILRSGFVRPLGVLLLESA